MALGSNLTAARRHADSCRSPASQCARIAVAHPLARASQALADLRSPGASTAPCQRRGLPRGPGWRGTPPPLDSARAGPAAPAARRQSWRDTRGPAARSPSASAAGSTSSQVGRAAASPRAHRRPGGNGNAPAPLRDELYVTWLPPPRALHDLVREVNSAASCQPVDRRRSSAGAQQQRPCGAPKPRPGAARARASIISWRSCLMPVGRCPAAPTPAMQQSGSEPGTRRSRRRGRSFRPAAASASTARCRRIGSNSASSRMRTRRARVPGERGPAVSARRRRCRAFVRVAAGSVVATILLRRFVLLRTAWKRRGT